MFASNYPNYINHDQIIDLILDFIKERVKANEVFEFVQESDFDTLLIRLEDPQERKRIYDFIGERLNKWHFFSKHVAKNNIPNYFKRGFICSTTNLIMSSTFFLFPPAPLIMFAVGISVGFTLKQGKHQYQVRKRAKQILEILKENFPQDTPLYNQTPVKKHHFWQHHKHHVQQSVSESHTKVPMPS